ncbi:MAG TPA: cysteine-rich CWC family protein [Candidatus Desulfobacillus sp.]|nr:cysteine-rich CWC family protein [Candidatus Desulfobacillus sp.]
MTEDCDEEATCPGCAGRFACGMQSGSSPCWCAGLPPLAALPSRDKGCFCPACLKAMIEAEGAVRPG